MDWVVCRNGFCKLHGVTVDRIKRLIKLKKQGAAPIDKRGKMTPGNTLSEDIVQKMIDHISSFPADDSHYKDTGYLYLNQRLSVATMFRLFKQEHAAVKASYHSYLNIFQTRFQLRFGQPKVDTCSTCEELQVKVTSKFLNEGAKRTAVAEKIVHLRRAKKFYKKLEELKHDNNNDVMAISFDFMQNLALPHLPVQDTFYLRQLTVCVFGIHNIKNGKGKYYIYHEGSCGKGANEVGSFLLHYLESIPENIKHLHIFSDNCYGQNRNHTIIRLLLALAHNRFESVTHYFPIRGHSYMPNDRDFAHVKKQLRTEDRVFTLKQFIRIIARVRNAEEIVMVKQKMILDLDSWWPRFFKKNSMALETSNRNVRRQDKVTFQITKFMQFTYMREGVIYAQHFIDGLTGYHFEMLNHTRMDKIPFDLKKVGKKQRISRAKMNDLLKFKRFIPQKQSVLNFWNRIYALPTHM